MFGYIRPKRSELLVKDSEYYNAIYCGLCRYGGKRVTHFTRWLLNYDFVLLAVMRISLSGEKASVCREYCPYRLKKKNCAHAESAFAFVSSAFALLTYGKYLDDLRDEKGVKRLALKCAGPFFKRMKKRSRADARLTELIENGLAEGIERETALTDDPDSAAEPFARMMGGIASCGLSGDNAAIAYQCGYHVGRFVYLADAFDDAYADEKTGSYNPFVLKYGSASNVYAAKEEIAQTLEDSLNVFSRSYAVACGAVLSAEDRIIFNIVELGGREAIKRIIERNTE